MADFRTVFTDDDGDGFYDDVHVVNVMDSHDYYPTNHTYSERHIHNSSSTGNHSSVFSDRTKLKIALIVFSALLGIALVARLGIFILYLIMK